MGRSLVTGSNFTMSGIYEKSLETRSGIRTSAGTDKKGLNNRNHDQHYADFAGIVSFTFTYAFAGRSASVVSIIGSAYYETYAATTALECVGETMKLNEYSAVGWVAAAWVMTIGGSACVLWSSLAIKPISMLYEKAEKIDMKLVLSIGAGCLAGVMAYVSVSYGFSAMSTKGVVFCISFAVGALLVWIHNKRPKAKWLSDYLMTISMLVAMAAACIIF